jgi:hypothetical protein
MKVLIEMILSMILLFVITPWLIVFVKSKKVARRLGIGLYLPFLMLDPAMSRALERHEIHEVIGHADEENQSDLLDPSSHLSKANGDRSNSL